MFRREFLTAFALLPFVGRFFLAKTPPDFAAALESLAKRFESHLKERVHYVRTFGMDIQKDNHYYVSCLLDTSDFHDPSTDVNFLIPMATALARAIPPRTKHSFQPMPTIRNNGCLYYVTEGGIRACMRWDTDHQKYIVTFDTQIIA